MSLFDDPDAPRSDEDDVSALMLVYVQNLALAMKKTGLFEDGTSYEDALLSACEATIVNLAIADPELVLSFFAHIFSVLGHEVEVPEGLAQRIHTDLEFHSVIGDLD